jgi:LemA protein
MQTQWIVIAVLAVVAIYVIIVFNRLIRSRNLVREGWSGIDVQLRRRSDLIPNLVEIVKGYAGHERTVFEDVAAKRTAAISAGSVPQKAAAEQALQGSIGKLFAVAEAYPELKANQNFLELQKQMADLEDQLQMARRYYNGTVRDFNTGIQTFPDVLIAGVFGFQEEHFFQIDAAAAAVPNVNFSGA